MTFDDSDTKLLIEICVHRVKAKELEIKPPAKETHFIGFKTQKHHPIPAEIIRCNADYAMIGAFESHCIVTLCKGKPVTGLEGDVFKFYEIFCYEKGKNLPTPKKAHADDDKSGSDQKKSSEEEDQPLIPDTEHRPSADDDSDDEKLDDRPKAKISEYQASESEIVIAESADIKDDSDEKVDQPAKAEDTEQSSDKNSSSSEEGENKHKEDEKKESE